MVTIVKKGTNSSVFVLRSGKTVRLAPAPVLNHIDDSLYDELMAEYGNFINERRVTDKNPMGCFLISDNASYVADQNKEIGDEIKDNSAPIEVTEGEIKPVKVVKRKKSK